MLRNRFVAMSARHTCGSNCFRGQWIMALEFTYVTDSVAIFRQYAAIQQ